MLYYQVQGKDECLPTSLAMLVGKPKDALVKEGLQAAGLDPSVSMWCDLFTSVDMYWKAADYLLAKYMGTEPKVWSASPTGSLPLDSLCHGRGVAVWAWPKAAHAVAFEEGRVVDPYDTYEAGPLSYAMRRMGHARLVAIYREGGEVEVV